MSEIPVVRKIELISVDALTPTDNNPRLNTQAVEEVAKSIAEYGFNQPIAIYGANNSIKAGHTRWKAAKLLQMDKVPCVRLSHIEAEKIDEKSKARKLAGYLIADNKTGEIAGWDEVALKTLLMEDIGINLDTLESNLPTGFKASELDILMHGFSYDLTPLNPDSAANKRAKGLSTSVTLTAATVQLRDRLLADITAWKESLEYGKDIRIG
jgi:hypothetical protein